MMEDLLSPPSCVLKMVEFNEDLFKKTINVVGMSISEREIGKIMKLVKPHMFCMRNVKSVRPSSPGRSSSPGRPSSPGRKTILLDPRAYGDVSSAQAKLGNTDIIKQLKDITYDECELDLGYDNWSAEEVLKAILPDEVPNVTGFSVIGHVAHLNLREVHTPYKSVIGRVLLDKHKNIQSVVNKTNSIDNTYRNFSMELLAGRDDMNVTVHENGCSFRFDFAKVYWNSRLSTEHERVIREITRNTVVYDVFAGVGPFCVPAAKKGATVYCNDLNPHSFASLQRNMTKNKVKGTCHCSNLDGRAFIQQVVKPNIVRQLSEGTPVAIVMNLPALAIDFLDAYVDLLSDTTINPPTETTEPRVYCYCFSKVSDENYEEDAAERINGMLPGLVSPVRAAQCRRVRNVAPHKEMLCAEFHLDSALLGLSNTHHASHNTHCKKIKLDTDK